MKLSKKTCPRPGSPVCYVAKRDERLRYGENKYEKGTSCYPVSLLAASQYVDEALLAVPHE